MQQSYIVTLRATLTQLKKDLNDAKAIAQTAKLPDVIAKARIDRKHILSDMQFIRRQLQNVASENRKPITLKANIDTADARRQLEALKRSAATITASIQRSPLTRPPVVASRASDRPNIAASMFSRTNRTADVSAAAASFRRSQSSQPPLRIPATVDPTAARKTIARLRDDADTPVHVPIRFRQPSGRSTEAIARKIVRDASAAAVITPRVDASKVMPAMGRIRQHARQLAADVSQPIRPRLDSREALQKIDEVKHRLDRMRNTRLNLSAISPSGGGFHGGMGMRSAFAGGMPGPSAGMLAGGLLAGAGGAFAGAGVAAGAAGVAGAGKVVSDGIGSLAQIEKTKSVLAVLLKDTDKAAELFRELEEIDLKLPGDLAAISDAATKLAASGFAPEEIGRDVVALMDAASVSSVGMDEGLQRLTRAFGQIRANGRLMQEELLQISELGLNVERVTQSQFGMSSRDLAEKSQSGEISVDDVLSGLLEGFRTEYGGSLESQSELMLGQLDQLSDRYRAVAREISAPLFQPLQNALQSLIDATKTEAFDDLTAALTSVSEAAGPFITQLGFLAEMAVKGAGATMNAAPAAGVKVAGIATSAATTAGGIVGSAKRLFGKADAATGGLLGQAAGMAGDVLDYAPTPGNITRGAFGAIGDAGASAMNAASDFVVNNQPARPKREAKAEPQPGIVDGLTTLAGGLTATVSDRIGAIADTFGDMAKDRASAFASMTGIDIASLPSAAMNVANDLRVGDAQREKDAVVKADDDTRFDKFADEMPAKMSDFAKGITDDETRQAFLASSLRLTQQNEGGRMLPTAELEELGKLTSRGSVETSGFADLNKLVQANVDAQRQQETQQKQLAVQEEMRAFLETIADQTKANNQPRTATIAPG